MIRITTKLDVFKGTVESLQVPYDGTKSIFDYVNIKLEHLELKEIDLITLFKTNTLKVLKNLHPIPTEDLKTTFLEDGDDLLVVLYPKIPLPFVLPATLLGSAFLAEALTLILTLAFNFLILGAIGLISSNLMGKPKSPTQNENEFKDSQIYTWDGPQTSYALGRSIPLLYGNVFTGGDIISSQVIGVGERYERDWRTVDGRTYPTVSEIIGNKVAIPYWNIWTGEERPDLVPENSPGITYQMWQEPIYNESEYRFVYQGWFQFPSSSDNWKIEELVCYVRTVDIAGNPVNPTPNWEKRGTITSSDPDIAPDPDSMAGWYLPRYLTVTVANDDGAGNPVYAEFYMYSILERVMGRYGEHWYHAPPSISEIQYRGYGHTASQRQELTTIYEQEALQIVLALSDGNVAKISWEDFYINDIPQGQLDVRTETQGVAQALEIATSKGLNVPIVDNHDTSYIVDLFNIKLLNTSHWDYVLNQGDLSPSNHFEMDTISSSVQGFNITIQFPNGLFKINDEGDEEAAKVEFWVRYAPYEAGVPPNMNGPNVSYVVGDSDEEIANNTFLIHQAHLGDFKINISVGSTGEALIPGKYRIQVIRKTIVHKEARRWDETKVIRVQEVSFVRQTYPNISTIAMRLLPTDKISGQIPNFNIPVKGRFVKVPILRNPGGQIIPLEVAYTEYNGGTESYDWKYYQIGTEETIDLTLDTTNTQYQFTSCTPFILWDLLTTQELHPHLLESDLEWTDFIEAAEICWEQIGVDQYAFNVEHRFETDIAIDSTMDAAEILIQLVSLIRGKFFWIGNKLRLRVMKPENMTQLFTEADIIKNTYKETYLPETKVPNTLEVTYYDRQQKYKQQTLQVSLKDASFYKERVRKESVSLIGVSKKSQALRAANYILNYAALSNKVIEFKAPISALASIPGDVVGVESSSITYVYGGFFRQDSYASGGTTTFYLDISVPLETGETYIFKISRRTGATAGLPSDEDEYQITVPSTDNYDYITVNQTIAPDYATNDVWMLTVTGATPETYIKKRRILYLSRDPKKDEVSVYCEPYDPAIYSDYNIEVTPQLPPVTPIDIFHSPVDVTSLTATQIHGTNNANVTYSIPDTEAAMFTSRVVTITGGNTITYSSTSDDSQFVSNRFVFIYDGTTGVYKGQLAISDINKTNKTFDYIEMDNFVGTLTTNDYIVQKREGSYLQVHYVDIAISSDGLNYTVLGQDYSRGAGYAINNLQANVTYYIRAQSVAVTGMKSLDPPIVEFLMGTQTCIDSPTHLSICGQGDGSLNFIGCDVCISWTQSSAYGGAGHWVEAFAGLRPAGATQDYKITGYHVWVYDNSGAIPQLMRQMKVTDETYEYSHDINIDDQYNTFSIKNKGQRKLLFRVYQEDADGNVSCEPAEIPVENVAPSMSGHTPSVVASGSSIIVNWESWINNPSLFPSDVLGYQVWYGQSDSSMAFADVSDPNEGQITIGGLPSGIYQVYVIPYDCFGVGVPKTTYRSTLVTGVNVSAEALPPYTPERPNGVSGSILIDSVNDGGTYYEIRCTPGTDLTSWGFTSIVDPGDPESAYAALDYSADYIYYNTNDAVSGYCYVTGTDLNTNNQITAIYYSTGLSRWVIRVPYPPSGVLAAHGYTVGDGAPQAGQYCAINVFAELGYEQGGGIWGGGVGSIATVRWHQDTSGSDRLSHYQLRHSRTTGPVSNTANFAWDSTKSVGDYYENNQIDGVAEDAINIGLSLWSDTGQQSTVLYANSIYVVKETAEFYEDALSKTVEWTAVQDSNGANLQVVIDNWDTLWQDQRIKEFEVFACLKQYNWGGSAWRTTPITAFTNMQDNYGEVIYRYQEFARVDAGHDVLINTDIGGDKYFFLGTSTGPVFHWTNDAVSNEGSICSNYGSGPPETCAAGWTNNLNTGNCPYGLAQAGQSCATNNSYSAAGTSDRTIVDSTGGGPTLNYNQYFVAIALKLVTGQRVFVVDDVSGLMEYQSAEIELIDRMHIKDAAITTAKIGDAMINNAKVKHLSADKVWIGDYAGTGSWTPYTEHCVWDHGSYCMDGYGSDDDPTSLYYQGKFNGVTGSGGRSCPIGATDIGGGDCNYIESMFAIERIFGMTNTPLNPRKEWTYIQGGMIMTDSIMARSIQVGALGYTLDLQVQRIWDETEWDADSYVYIKWYKAGEDPNAVPPINAYVAFLNGTGYFIAAGEKKFTQLAGEVPVTSGRKIHIGYIDLLAISGTGTESIVFTDMLLEEGSPGGWTVDGSFTQLRSEGKLPLFAVVITKQIPATMGEAVISGDSLVDPADNIGTDMGQFNAQIIMAAPSSGTYITNNDITTGVIHNEYWTSYLDMRFYTGYNSTINYKGHGRLVIDAPSSLYNRAVMSAQGDAYGKEWWDYVSTWAHVGYDAGRGTDTKLLIGEPYIDGLEVEYPALNKSQTEALGDSGYLWFYRQYNTTAAQWEGFLEIGGKLRVKDLTNYRELLVGQEYVLSGINWQRSSAAGLFLYDIQAHITTPSPLNPPEKLVQLGGEVPVTVVGTSNTAHYFNVNPNDRNFTVTIDHNSQVPVATWTDWGYASLLVVPSTDEYKDKSAGILIRSGAGDTDDWPYVPTYGLYIQGNLAYGIYTRIEADVVSGYYHGISAWVDCPAETSISQGVSGTVLGGNDSQVGGGSFAANVGDSVGAWVPQAHGVVGGAFSDYAPNQLFGGEFQAGRYDPTIPWPGPQTYSDGTSVTVGVYIQVDTLNLPHDRCAHICFGALSSSGYNDLPDYTSSSYPPNSMGDRGDFIASKYRLYYKCHHSDTGTYPRGRWRCIAFV